MNGYMSLNVYDVVVESFAACQRPASGGRLIHRLLPRPLALFNEILLLLLQKTSDGWFD